MLKLINIYLTVFVLQLTICYYFFTAFDQYGIPAGRFHKGHWSDPANQNDQRCPNGLFPSNTDPSFNRYPIFDLVDCNRHPPMLDIGVRHF